VIPLQPCPPSTTIYITSPHNLSSSSLLLFLFHCNTKNSTSYESGPVQTQPGYCLLVCIFLPFSTPFTYFTLKLHPILQSLDNNIFISPLDMFSFFCISIYNIHVFYSIFVDFLVAQIKVVARSYLRTQLTPFTFLRHFGPRAFFPTESPNPSNTWYTPAITSYHTVQAPCKIPYTAPSESPGGISCS